MLTYMLDTDICIYVMKNYPAELRDRFDRLADQICISTITLGELHLVSKSQRVRWRISKHWRYSLPDFR